MVSYDKVNKMPRELDPAFHHRAAIIGATMPYISFINLFLRPLALFGRKPGRK